MSRATLRRRQGSGARALAQGLLPPGEWVLTGGGETRPRFTAADGSSGPDVSLSHSGGWVAAALTGNGRIGIDLEIRRAGRDWRAMAEAYLSPRECHAVARDGEDAFLAFWTLREAVAKLGEGGLATALSLDGGDIVSGRNGGCRGGFWVAAHRRVGSLHVAAAWAPDPLVGEAGPVLALAMDGLAGVCKHIQDSL